MVRTFGRDEDHPTVVSFSHIYRLLSLYTPIKACVTGNVMGEPTTVLATVNQTMRAKKKEVKTGHERLEACLRSKLLQICISAHQTPRHDHMHDHVYTDTSAQDCVIYYQCGYLVRSIGKHTKCEPCMDDIQGGSNECLEAYLTLAREFRAGSLKYPSRRMFAMFKSVEGKIASALTADDLCKDMMLNLLDALEGCAIARLVCNDHSDVFTVELLPSYVVLCIHFFAKDTCENLSVSEKVATSRKKAKLL